MDDSTYYYVPTFKEAFVARFWPADPFDGIWVFASKLSYEDQISCAAAQVEIDQLRQSKYDDDLAASNNCWQTNQFADCLCRVSPKLAEKIGIRLQLTSEYIAAKVRGYHGNQGRVMLEAATDQHLKDQINQIDDAFCWILSELEAD